MRRQGYTLVEMLVSLALVLFIMVILSQAFSTGLEVFRQLKGVGEMEERLRMASTILRQDLKLDHFEGKRRLSDPGFWTQGPPREGFFHIQQLDPSTRDGFPDGDGIQSIRATTHSLHFSIKLRGSQREDFLSAKVLAPVSPVAPLSPLYDTTFFGFSTDSRYQDSPSTYNSQWAEVVYFLYPTNASTPNSVSLSALYRRQRLAVPNNLKANWASSQQVRVISPKELIQNLNHDYGSISCGKADPNKGYPDVLYFNNPTDLTVPERRFASYAPLQDPNPDPQNNQTGADLLLTDVASFTVRVLSPDLPNGGKDFSDLPRLSFPGQQLPVGVFDTWSTVHDDIYNYEGKPAPVPIRILALEITLRVWDMKTQQTRQITIIQDM
jgi:prepilin-type N-terminal cleavage/methylation domain-containing protein